MPTTDPLYPSTAPKRPGVPGDGFLGRQDFAKYVARILPTITEESKVAFAAWVHSTPTRIDRTKWWMDSYPAIKKLNHWGRLLFTDKILADPLVRSEIDRLRLEDEQSGLMTQRQRRQKLKTIADTTEHPTRGFADQIKAMELDAGNEDFAFNHVDILILLGRKDEAYRDLKKLLDAGCQPGRLQGFYARLKKKKK